MYKAIRYEYNMLVRIVLTQERNDISLFLSLTITITMAIVTIYLV